MKNKNKNHAVLRSKISTNYSYFCCTQQVLTIPDGVRDNMQILGFEKYTHPMKCNSKD
jgi:hypothetical protein